MTTTTPPPGACPHPIVKIITNVHGQALAAQCETCGEAYGTIPRNDIPATGGIAGVTATIETMRAAAAARQEAARVAAAADWSEYTAGITAAFTAAIKRAALSVEYAADPAFGPEAARLHDLTAWARECGVTP